MYRKQGKVNKIFSLLTYLLFFGGMVISLVVEHNNRHYVLWAVVYLWVKAPPVTTNIRLNC